MQERVIKWFTGGAAALALLLLSHLTYTAYSLDTLPLLDDVAISFAVGKSTLEGQPPLIGQPSHLGGRHFGALYYYVVATALWLAHEDLLVTMMIFAGLKLCGVAITALLAYRLSQSFGAVSATATVLVASAGPLLAIIRLPWVNHFLLLPSAVFFFVLWSAVKYGPRVLPFLFIAATCVVQTFYGSVPLVGTCIAATLVMWLVKREAFRAAYAGRAQRIGFGIVMLLWVPPVVFEFVYAHNMLRMVSKHLVQPPHAIVGLPAAFGHLWGFVEFYLLNHIVPPGGWRWLVIGGWALVAIDYLRLANEASRRFWFVVLCGVVAYTVALSRITPPFHLFYLYATLPALCAFIGCVVGHATVKIVRLMRMRPLCISLAGAVSVVVVPLALMRLSEAVSSQREHFSTLPLPPYSSIRHAQEIAAVINEARGAESSVRLFIRGETKHRTNGVYWYLGTGFYPRMAYAGFFKELRLFAREPRTTEALGFLLACSTNGELPAQGKSRKKQLERDWVLGEEISLATCSTCSGCRMHKLVPRSQSEMSPPDVEMADD